MTVLGAREAAGCRAHFGCNGRSNRIAVPNEKSDQSAFESECLGRGGAVGVVSEKGENGRQGERDGRIPLQAKVVITHKKTGERMEGEACDLSMGGMFIKTLLPPRPGTLVDVEIQMKPLNFRGRARIMDESDAGVGADQPYGMAVVWVDLTPNQKRLLSIRINDHIRGGGQLLDGDPYEADETPRVATKSVAPAAAVTLDRNHLIIGLAAAAVVVVVLVVVLVFL